MHRADIIKVENLAFAYDNDSEEEVLQGITFSLKPGTITGLIGPSGCGKSTLCQILCGIIPQCIGGTLSGTVLVCGQPADALPLKLLCQKVGYVMQDPDRQIIASVVEDELAFGPENLMLPREEIRRRVETSMKLLGIEHLALKNPLNLSGGQKQMVAAAAVLTMEPEILIMDEPLSHVDQQGRELMLDMMKELRERGRTVLVVEHEYEPLDFADQWLALDQGRIKAMGPPTELLERGMAL